MNTRFIAVRLPKDCQDIMNNDRIRTKRSITQYIIYLIRSSKKVKA